MHREIFVDTGRGPWDSAGGRGWTLYSTQACGMDSEKELIDAFDRFVHKEFPNPQRIDCPPKDVLLALAQQSESTQLTATLAHIRQCAPCFDELRELRRQTARTQA